MTTYASISDLASVARAYEVDMPDEPTAQRALDLASHDLDRFLGATYPDLDVLEDEQVAALRDGCAIQAAFRLGMDPEAMLGVVDDLAAVGGVSFSLRPLPRLSVEAAERVSGFGLLVRSATVPPEPEAA